MASYLLHERLGSGGPLRELQRSARGGVLRDTEGYAGGDHSEIKVGIPRRSRMTSYIILCSEDIWPIYRDVGRADMGGELRGFTTRESAYY